MNTNHNAAVTEVERAACALLNQSHPDHPGLRAYVAAIISDETESRSLQTYIDADPSDTCDRLGYVGRSGQGSASLRHRAMLAVMDEKPRGYEPQNGDEAWAAAHDRHILGLAQAVTNYRTAGRPTGDQTHVVEGAGGPLLTVTTSLAAAISEYHHGIVNIWACRDEFDAI